MRKSPKRDQLIQTALTLFAKHGLHGTGVDTIVEQSGVTKKTLYAHFHSKDDLILEVLRHYDAVFRTAFKRQVEAAGKTPVARLLAIRKMSIALRHRPFKFSVVLLRFFS